ncbi:MAG TPA: M28 family peptidase [Bryobacteraceae bacterium]|nr:M28 family peptidase [Bryobacteraceae bacterium]
MYKTNRLKWLGPLLLVLLVYPAGASPFRGTAALADARRAVAFGERASGSAENKRQREWILAELKPLGGQITVDSFTARTPSGPVEMANILLKFPGTTGKAIAVSGHYDTKKIPMVHFVGANDGGSSTGFLLEFARAAAKAKHRNDLLIIFFDGEEAVLADWTDTDSRYGSRHLTEKWSADGTLSRLIALINVDMIGDKDLDIAGDQNSSARLRSRMKAAAARLGYAHFFLEASGAIDDDHKPFADAGVEVLDVIDLDYGPGNKYWHTAQDTLDKLSARSLQVVGDVVFELVRELDG